VKTANTILGLNCKTKQSGLETVCSCKEISTERFKDLFQMHKLYCLCMRTVCINEDCELLRVVASSSKKRAVVLW